MRPRAIWIAWRRRGICHEHAGGLAAALGLTIGRQAWLAFHSEAATLSHYVRFTIPKMKWARLAARCRHHIAHAAQLAQRWI